MHTGLAVLGVIAGVLIGLALIFAVITIFAKILAWQLGPRNDPGDTRDSFPLSGKAFLFGLWALAGLAVVFALFWSRKEIASFLPENVPFLAKMAGLTIAYLTALLGIGFLALIFRREPLGFHGALSVIGIEIGPDRDKKSANNRRWMCLLAMTILTFFIAIANPGPALIMSVWEDIHVHQDAKHGWDTLKDGIFGVSPPPPDSTSEEKEPLRTWFWWKAFWLYLIALIIYAFAAFGDDLIDSIKAAWRKWREGMAERRAIEKAQAEAAAKATEAQGKGKKKGGQQQAPPLPQQVPIKRFLAWELAFDILGEFLGSFFAKRFGA